MVLKLLELKWAAGIADEVKFYQHKRQGEEEGGGGEEENMQSLDCFFLLSSFLSENEANSVLWKNSFLMRKTWECKDREMKEGRKGGG